MHQNKVKCIFTVTRRDPVRFTFPRYAETEDWNGTGRDCDSRYGTNWIRNDGQAYQEDGHQQECNWIGKIHLFKSNT